MNWYQVGIIFSDRQGKVLDVNDGFTQILGYTRDEMLSGHVQWSELLPPDQKQLSQWAAIELKCSGSHPPFIRDYLHRNGKRVSLLVQSFYLRQDNGFYVGILQSLNPAILSQGSATRYPSLSLKEQGMLALQECTQAVDQFETDLTLPYRPMGICFFDRNLRYTQINPVLASINGYSIEAHWGQKFRDLLPNYAAQYEPLLQHVLKTGNPILNLVISGEVPGEPEHYGRWLANYHPIRTTYQGTIGVGVTLTEIYRSR